MGLLMLWGCTPDVPTDPLPKFFEFQFDPSANPPKSFEPTLLVTNPETLRLDFSIAGIEIPADPLECASHPKLSQAECELYWYLEQLDGFPTLTPGRTPVSAAVDTSTVTAPSNLFVLDMMKSSGPVTSLDIAYDADTGYLVFDPKAGWDVGGLYVVGIRGYANGVKDTNGSPGVKSIIYVLLSQDDSLTCGATKAEEVSESCSFYSLFESDARFASLPPAEKKAAIAGTLVQLEQLRQAFKGELPGGLPFSLWDVLEENAQMPPSEVAIVWAFRTHSASVVELNPTKGMMPRVTGPREIRLKAKGPIDKTTLSAFGIANQNGSVFLLDGTAFLAGNVAEALPAFTPDYADGDIVLRLDADLVDQHQYILLLTDQVHGKPGVPIVPSPVTVFLRSRGQLVDDFAKCASNPVTAKSLVSSLKAVDACQLEEGRLQFKELLDNEMVKSFTTTTDRPNGLTREMITFMFGFEYVAQ